MTSPLYKIPTHATVFRYRTKRPNAKRYNINNRRQARANGFVYDAAQLISNTDDNTNNDDNKVTGLFPKITKKKKNHYKTIGKCRI